MALRLRFHFSGKCCVHPRYNPENDGRPKDGSCAGCETLWCIWLYVGIAERKAKNGEGLARESEDKSENAAEVIASSPAQTDTSEVAAETRTTAPVEED